MKRRKYGNNTKPIMSTLTPFRSVCKKRRSQETESTPQRPAHVRPRKRMRLYSAESDASSPHLFDQDPEEEVRRELGLDTNNLIQGSDGEEGEVLELDDGYQY